MLPLIVWPGVSSGAWWHVRKLPGYRKAWRAWIRDLRRDPTPNRGRRFGQALVLAREMPPSVEWIYAHFLHTPASVARYAALMRGLPWSCSAHAKDIYTTPAWEKAEKIAEMKWLVTCTRANVEHLKSVANGAADRVSLLYHGIDLSRFPEPPVRPERDGSSASDPVKLLSVGRAVEKKGFDVLLKALKLLFDRLGHGLSPLRGNLAAGAIAAPITSGSSQPSARGRDFGRIERRGSHGIHRTAGRSRRNQ